MKYWVIFPLLFLTACSSMDKAMTGSSAMPDEDERIEMVKSFSGISADQKASFIRGEPWVGMSQEHLESLFGGGPKKSQKKISSAGNQEIQLYAVRVGNWKTGVKTKYFKTTMTGGKLTDFQELDSEVGSFDKL